MVQVSAGRSIAQAYGFLFRRILTVIGLSWVAAAFFIVLRKALLGLGPVPHNVIAHWPQALEHLGGVVAAVLLLCAIAVPLTRAALGEAMEWSLAHFVIGARELRLFAALVRLYLILIAITIIGALAVAGAGMGTKMALAHWPALAGTGLPVKAIAVGIAAVVAVVVAIYIAVRLSFLLYAIAVAEPHASLKRSWELAKGHVLRMVLIALAIAVPVYVLFFVAQYAVMGQPLVDALQALFAVKPPNQAPLYALLAAHGWGVATAAGVMVVVLTALGTTASASVYRGLLSLDVDETPTVLDEEAVVIEEAVAAPADHHAGPAEHHEAPVEESHDHGGDGHDETGHHETHEGDAAHQAAPAEGGHGQDEHAHAGHGPGEEPQQDDHVAEAHDDHGHDAPAEEHHGEENHAAEHTEQDAAAHDAHAEDVHDGHGEVEHHEVHAAEAPHAEELHLTEAQAEAVHDAEAPHVEETHDGAAQAVEPHREVEHA